MPPTPPRKRVGGMGDLPSGDQVKHHFARKSIKNVWGNHTSAKVAISGAVRRGELLRGKVSQGSTSPLKLCVKG